MSENTGLQTEQNVDWVHRSQEERIAALEGGGEPIYDITSNSGSGAQSIPLPPKSIDSYSHVMFTVNGDIGADTITGGDFFQYGFDVVEYGGVILFNLPNIVVTDTSISGLSPLGAMNIASAILQLDTFDGTTINSISCGGTKGGENYIFTAYWYLK